MNKKKINLYKFFPIIIAALLIIGGLIYARINGISNEDYLNRTSNFWVPTGMAFLGYGVLHVSLCVDSIKKKDYLVLVFQTAQSAVVIAAAIYWLNLTDQMILLWQQIREYSEIENWTAANQLTQVRFEIWSKRHWLSFAVTIIVFVLNEAPLLIRKIQKRVQKYKEHKNRGEDQ